MSALATRAPAKINLTLHVLGRRADDGYHALESLVAFAGVADGLTLAPGDCVVVLSDGFPEMFNPANEMLGFHKAAEILKENADRTSQEIINRLIETSDNWANGRPPDDDVTFVVLKVKADSAATL